MKARLGDDTQDGWLLLGGPDRAGSASDSLNIVAGPGGSSALSYHQAASAAVAAATSTPSIGGHGGGGGGGLLNRTLPR